MIRPDSIGQPSPMPQYRLHVSVYQHVCMHVYIQISLWMVVTKNPWMTALSGLVGYLNPLLKIASLTFILVCVCVHVYVDSYCDLW